MPPGQVESPPPRGNSARLEPQTTAADWRLYDFVAEQFVCYVPTGELQQVHGPRAVVPDGPWAQVLVHENKPVLLGAHGTDADRALCLIGDHMKTHLVLKERDGFETPQKCVRVRGQVDRWEDVCRLEYTPKVYDFHTDPETSFKAEYFMHDVGVVVGDATITVWVSLPWVFEHLFGKEYNVAKRAKSWREYLESEGFHGGHVRDSLRSLQNQARLKSEEAFSHDVATRAEQEFSISVPGLVLILIKATNDKRFRRKASSGYIGSQEPLKLLRAFLERVLDGKRLRLVSEPVEVTVDSGVVDETALQRSQHALRINQRTSSSCL